MDADPVSFETHDPRSTNAQKRLELKGITIVPAAVPTTCLRTAEDSGATIS
jgi:hypothetical protein